MTNVEPTAAQVADALRTAADALEQAPDWLVRNTMKHCAESLALIAKWKLSQREDRAGYQCRRCQRDGTVSMFATVRELYLHGIRSHRDLMAARALKAVERGK